MRNESIVILLRYIFILFVIQPVYAGKKLFSRTGECEETMIKANRARLGYISLAELRRIQSLRDETSLDAPIEGTEDLTLYDLSFESQTIKPTFEMAFEEEFFEKFFSYLRETTGYGRLSHKDIDVLEFLMEGKNPSEIARETGVTRQAVEQRIAKIQKRIPDALRHFNVIDTEGK